MSRLDVNTKWCKGCGICVILCPKKVLEIRNEKVSVEHPDDCIRCRICEQHCPDFAIFVKEAD